MPGNIYEFNIYPNLRCPSLVQARIRLKSKSQHYFSPSSSSTTKPSFETHVFEKPLPTNQSMSEYQGMSSSHRQSQGLKPKSTTTQYDQNSVQYHHQYKTKSNDFVVEPTASSYHHQQQRHQGVDFTSDYPPHFQNPQISTHKIYVHSMTPAPQPAHITQEQNSLTQKSDNYITTDHGKSYSTFSPSVTQSDQDRQQQMGYQAEFTVKSGSGNPSALGHGGYSSSPMAKSFSSIPTNASMPAAFQNHSSNSFGANIYHSPASKSYTNFSTPPDEKYYIQGHYYPQEYREYPDYQEQVPTYTSNNNLYTTSAETTRSYSALPNCIPSTSAAQVDEFQANYSNNCPFSSPMAKSYSNFSQPFAPVFDASSILRCYSSAAIMQQHPNGMLPSMPQCSSMDQMSSMGPFSSMQPFSAPLPIIPLQSMSPPAMNYPESSMQMPMYMHQQMQSCGPSMPMYPSNNNNMAPVQKYEFADFQPDLCCIGRHLKRLRDRYRQQQCVAQLS